MTSIMDDIKTNDSFVGSGEKERLVFKNEISYPWKTVGHFNACNCMSQRVSANLEDLKIVIQIEEDLASHTFVATIEEISLNERGKVKNLCSISANGCSVEEAYMTARNAFLKCECEDPPNELYDLGYPRPPTFWSQILSFFQN